MLLKENADNFEAKQNKQINKQTTTRVMEKLNWWLEIIPGYLSSINKPEVNFVVNTDATKSGWRMTNGESPTRVICSE